jgi:phosphopantothenoylcysteine decarboxylase / phosphopantothenate---cysteine ligase
MSTPKHGYPSAERPQEPIVLENRRILLIIAGGIAAYKSLELIRRLKDRGARVRCILTKSGAEFITPLSVASLSGEKCYTDLFSLTDESEMGHIRLSREADLVVVAPATADLMAKMSAGLADDLASTALLATDKRVMLAPAMNVEMWGNPATRRNASRLVDDGVLFVGPAEGDMACGEIGSGRLAEVPDIVAAIEGFFRDTKLRGPLAGRRALVTAGPTQEAIDPVRHITNRSSGKQGYAVAQALSDLGADTTLVAGPTALADPEGIHVVHVKSARDMLAACEAALPADVAVCVAAVADWRPSDVGASKIKKNGKGAPKLDLVENPHILATLSKPSNRRPKLVIGFAAETENVVENAAAKRAKYGCDWVLANDVATGTQTFGGETNRIHLVTDSGIEDWPESSKIDIGRRLAARIAEALRATGA